ncbi:MAG: acetolactate decarboxylase [Ignavibacteria bacterium]
MLRLKESFIGLIFLFTLSFAQNNRITQISTINALMAGVYDGNYSLGELKRYGDFGLGTFNNLDGEMLMLDGICYRMKSDGSVQQTDDNQLLPFATVTLFRQDKPVDNLTEGTNQQVLEKQIDSLLPTLNIFYAVRLDGLFKAVKARSVPKQYPPYISLVEVVKKQSEFMFEDVEGTILGFRSPAFVKGLNVPGYHFHFISKDRKRGGHVLNFIIKKASAKIENISELSLLLPSDSEFYKASLAEDKQKELNKIEK